MGVVDRVPVFGVTSPPSAVWVLSTHRRKELLVSNAHARLPVHGQVELVRRIVEQGRLTRSQQTAGPRVGFDHVHCAVDDHLGLAYAEIPPR